MSTITEQRTAPPRLWQTRDRDRYIDRLRGDSDRDQQIDTDGTAVGIYGGEHRRIDLTSTNPATGADVTIQLSHAQILAILSRCVDQAWTELGPDSLDFITARTVYGQALADADTGSSIQSDPDLHPLVDYVLTRWTGRGQPVTTVWPPV